MLGKQVAPASLILIFHLGACMDSADPEDPICAPPQAPVLSVIHQGATLEFDPLGGNNLVVGTSQDLQSEEPDGWLDQDEIILSGGTVKVFAKADNPHCPQGQQEQTFTHVYRVQDGYPAPAGESGSTAVAMDDARIHSWASDFVEPVDYGSEVLDQFQTPELALGPASGITTDVVSLGRGGEITLRFDPPIADGEGDDLAVFENGITDSFLELAFVEVSSDGNTFVRFDSASLTTQPVDPFGSLDTTRVGGLAGKYRQGFGTPFDLANLKNRPEVSDGRVDLGHIGYVKVVDLIGDGGSVDSFGHPVYDPHPTLESAGFDLEAVGVLHSR